MLKDPIHTLLHGSLGGHLDVLKDLTHLVFDLLSRFHLMHPFSLLLDDLRVSQVVHKGLEQRPVAEVSMSLNESLALLKLGIKLIYLRAVLDQFLGHLRH